MRYLFNTRGKYVGFVSGRDIFFPNGEYYGYVPQANEVYAKNGHFIGYLLDDDRIVRRVNEMPRLPQMPPFPPFPPLPPLPPLPRLPKLPLPYPYEDVFERL